MCNISNKIVSYLPYVIVGATVFIYCALSVGYVARNSNNTARLSAELKKIRRAIAEERNNDVAANQASGVCEDESDSSDGGGSNKTNGMNSTGRTRRNSPSPPHSAHDLRYFRFN